MSFIEMTGTTLERIVAEDELHHGDLAEAASMRRPSSASIARATSKSAARPAGT